MNAIPRPRPRITEDAPDISLTVGDIIACTLLLLGLFIAALATIAATFYVLGIAFDLTRTIVMGF